jgi:hypothetical protein
LHLHVELIFEVNLIVKFCDYYSLSLFILHDCAGFSGVPTLLCGIEFPKDKDGRGGTKDESSKQVNREVERW